MTRFFILTRGSIYEPMHRADPVLVVLDPGAARQVMCLYQSGKAPQQSGWDADMVAEQLSRGSITEVTEAQAVMMGWHQINPWFDLEMGAWDGEVY